MLTKGVIILTHLTVLVKSIIHQETPNALLFFKIKQGAPHNR